MEKGVNRKEAGYQGGKAGLKLPSPVIGPNPFPQAKL
jgi:hypothetical protein